MEDLALRVFIGSSSEGLEVAEALQVGLQHDAEVTVWTQAVFAPGVVTSSALMQRAQESDFAALVLTPDDVVMMRDKEVPKARDNVIFELGLFAGALGLDRALFVYRQDAPIELPSDLAGVTALTYGSREDGNLLAAVGPVCTMIKQHLRRVGPRRSPAAESAVTAEDEQRMLPGFVAGAGEEYGLTSWIHVVDRARHATKRIDLLQTWIPWLRTEEERWVGALGRPDVKMRVLLIDPKLASYRTAYRDKDTGHLLPTVAKLRDLAALHNTPDAFRVQGRFYACLPFGPIYAVDDDVYWGLYYSHCDSLLGPAFHCKRSTSLGQLITASFERAWQRGRTSSGGLHLPGPPSRLTPPDPAAAQVFVEGMAASLHGRVVPHDISRGAMPPSGGLLVVLRHAETWLNIHGIFSGELDVGISRRGIDAVSSIGEALRGVRWDHIYCSTLQRSRGTLLHSLGQSLEPLVHDRDEIRERCMGDVEGLPKDRYGEERPHYASEGIDLLGNPFASAVGGESYVDVFMRLFPFLERLVRFVESGQKILVCTHETPLRLMRMALESRPFGECTGLVIENALPYAYGPLGRA